MMPPTFIIWSPGYTNASGGIIALHLLAHELTQMGLRVLVAAPTKNPAWNYELLTTQTWDKDNTVVLYPEIINGNPLKGKHVVRWLLNTPGVCGGNGDYPSTDLIFTYWDYFQYHPRDRVVGELRMFTAEFDIFFNRNIPRSGQCFAVHKGVSKLQQKVQHQPDATNVETMEKQQRSEVFNNKELFVCYDHVTHFALQAALCGCPTVVIPDGKSSSEEWHSKLPAFKYGIAYGFEELAWARETLPLVKSHIESLMKENILLVQKFVEICLQRLTV
jgi:hypothetical protein